MMSRPASCGNFASSCTHSQNRQIFPDLTAIKKSKYETSNGLRSQAALRRLEKTR